jgi:RecA/RadA recombinase
VSYEFRSGLELFKDGNGKPKLTTGNADLDSLLGGGIERGHFYLFYGDTKSGVDVLIHQLLVNCLLPKEKNGFAGKAIYLNCGNYRYEKTLLDSNLLNSLTKILKIDPIKALDDIYVVCAFSEEQQKETIVEIRKLLEKDEEIRLVVVHNIAKLFTSKAGTTKNHFGKRIIKLQKVVLELWQACAQKNTAFVASCQPNKTSKKRIPQPEGGEYLRHEANVIVYLRKKSDRAPSVTAYLRKHPGRALRKVDFLLTVGGHTLKRTETPFRIQLKEELDTLKRSYREALLNASRRKAFDNLLTVWLSKQGTMSYAKVPTTLDIMLLTAIIDNKKLIGKLLDQVDIINSKMDRPRTHLKKLEIGS